ncbi:membrane protein insertase YidC [Frigidibacter sp. RF13]|uniref:membrane protein insertase YidC n=1 Tax=Frigidibacter sp. RF13 TaxID=2997340 RepID=UPI00227111DA|nr:membrane protein insertase YidC [Frigidibacter sp. RF13]MCY1127435.1 membrane protein insertase YidC [Frigidibacter sp. RF13]
MDDQNKNLILATVLSFLVILVWYTVFAPPPGADLTAPPPAASQQAADGQSIDPAPGATTLNDPAATTEVAAALAAAPRVEIETPRLSGSISLLGGRIDDLLLSDYRVSLAAGSDAIRLLSPEGGAADAAYKPYFALYGWVAGQGAAATDMPGATTLWTLAKGDKLTPDTPVELSWDNGKGLTFRRLIEVDSDFMFKITQSVENKGATAVRMSSYGVVARRGLPKLEGFYIAHEGAIRMSDGRLEEIDYDEFADLEVPQQGGLPTSEIAVTGNGWIGFTDKYFMTSLAPSAGQPFRSVVRFDASRESYEAWAIEPEVEVAPGASASVSTQLFAGAKKWEAIKAYQAAGIDRFVDAIDWGWFYFLTKPMFLLLHWLNGTIGNMGWAIIALTFVIKTLVFPLARKSYISMAKMKELQPEMEKLKAEAGDDRQKMQQGMMALYKKEKVNPASGCLPILIQIPIFFALYKVIFVTLDLRHAAWIGWIKDLSAPDPSSILNLFGLLPWATPEPGSLFFLFSLGVLPILLGISMWFQQKLNPAPTDPTQAAVFAWMPWIFMFMLGSFASGLVLYWITNNTITFIQQYTIMAMHGKRPDIFGNIRAGFKRNGAPEK